MAQPFVSSELPTLIVGGVSYLNVTSSVLVKSGGGYCVGIFVASASSSPTIKLWDQTSAATPVLVNTFTPFAGTWYPIPFRFTNGLFITIGGTVDCTVSYN